MNSPQETRQFLRWYQGDAEPPDTSPELPDWYEDRVPKPRDESDRVREENRRIFVPFENYDLKTRLRDEAPDDWQWRSPEQSLPAIERTWRESTENEGLEAFAWYVPFHFSRDYWGIYIDEVGLQLLGHLFYEWSRDLERPSRGGARTNWSPGDPVTEPIEGAGAHGEPAFESRERAFSLALEVLLRHEWYHHQVELLASHLEDISDSLHYEQYHADVYQDTFAGEACIEESLANAYVYRSRAHRNRAPSRDVFHALFHKSTEQQPTAYQNYHRYLGSEFQRGGQYLGHIVQTAHPTYAPQGITDSDHRLALGANLPFTTGLHQPRDHRPVPIYVVRPAYRPPTLSSFRAVQLETNYEIIRSDKWSKKYQKSDSDLQNLADKTVGKLERNVNLPGFRWRSCPQGYEYGRMNEQYRFIVDRDERAEEVELVDFGRHDLPKTEYNCY